ncbi:hypothetical protein H696_03739 [Fonticula alba]|uniref:BZIP domain-containing protein n=1 Tax=Fonticula alba TaxID=691883 RepID=A0A058Z6Z8_FONAL|nr:hypothetical protein H696_03739 [Fonticula alba]KCV69307.1 hypothetical protein H696_03739 [Fonticula alba]|eukprot:XP_009495872.1 hypothetical protein H696_03739 [Fonticula alba]
MAHSHQQSPYYTLSTLPPLEFDMEDLGSYYSYPMAPGPAADSLGPLNPPYHDALGESNPGGVHVPQQPPPPPPPPSAVSSSGPTPSPLPPFSSPTALGPHEVAPPPTGPESLGSNEDPGPYAQVGPMYPPPGPSHGAPEMGHFARDHPPPTGPGHVSSPPRSPTGTPALSSAHLHSHHMVSSHGHHLAPSHGHSLSSGPSPVSVPIHGSHHAHLSSAHGHYHLPAGAPPPLGPVYSPADPMVHQSHPQPQGGPSAVQDPPPPPLPNVTRPASTREDPKRRRAGAPANGSVTKRKPTRGAGAMASGRSVSQATTSGVAPSSPSPSSEPSSPGPSSPGPGSDGRAGEAGDTLSSSGAVVPLEVLRKRNSESSARYRRKKAAEFDSLRLELQGVQDHLRRVQEERDALERQVIILGERVAEKTRAYDQLLAVLAGSAGLGPTVSPSGSAGLLSSEEGAAQGPAFPPVAPAAAPAAGHILRPTGK